MTRRLPLAPYIVDTLMRDLVGHDRAPSAFLVYLWLWHNTRAVGRRRLAASLQMLATETGLSKSSIQNAVRTLTRRRLLAVERPGSTEPPIYVVLENWRRLTRGAV